MKIFLHCKATDCHQYLHYDSCHPDHMKKLSIYSQGLRVKGLCSDNHKLQKHLENLKNWFCDRSYPRVLVDEQLQRVKGKSRAELLRPKGIDKKSVGVPFVVTNHPHLKNIGNIITKHIKHLCADPEVKSIFTPLRLVSVSLFCAIFKDSFVQI